VVQIKLYIPFDNYCELLEFGYTKLGNKEFYYVTGAPGMGTVFKDEVNLYKVNWKAIRTSDNRIECYPVRVDPQAEDYAPV